MPHPNRPLVGFSFRLTSIASSRLGAGAFRLKPPEFGKTTAVELGFLGLRVTLVRGAVPAPPGVGGVLGFEGFEGCGAAGGLETPDA